MKKLSIGTRITLWYGGFLLLISAALIVVLVLFFTLSERSQTEQRLIQTVEDVSDRISSDGEEYIFDSRIEYYVKETYLSVYDKDYELVAGRRPRGFEVFPDLSVEEVFTAKDAAGDDWYVYDTEIYMDEGKDLYIRGMMNAHGTENHRNDAMQLILYVIPTLIVLAIIGGWIMSRNALAPIRNLLGLTNEITEYGDFSKRLEVPESGDEAESLAIAFNEMFDRIEDVLDREKQFSSDVAHELRTPITVISTQSEFALEEPDYSDDALRKINKEARRMGRLVSSLLTLSRSDSGRLNPNIQKVDLEELIESLAEQGRQNTEERGIELEYIKEDEGAVIVQSDEDYLIRMIINLLDNAVQYGKGEGGRIQLRLGKDADQAVITVADDGEGIPEDEQDAVWQRFYQSDSSRSREGSSGLGLSMVYALAKALGGEVRYIAEDKRKRDELPGAVFEIRLPLNA